MSTCLTCGNWALRSTPAWAARIGMACCDAKQTKAVTMSHWAGCEKHRALAESKVAARREWLVQRLGPKVLRGSK